MYPGASQIAAYTTRIFSGVSGSAGTMHNLSPTKSSEKPSSLTAIPPFAFEDEEGEETLLLVRLADLR